MYRIILCCLLSLFLVTAAGCGAGDRADPEFCDDGVDNDADGATDCGDNDCLADPACPAGETDCVNGKDDDSDGQTDCDDTDCDDNFYCRAGPESECADGVDNDSDGQTDCDDTDCRTSISCRPDPETDCADDVDNDSDGQTDCDDSDCAQDTACETIDPEVDCEDGIDNDADGQTDCDDGDCAPDPACEVVVPEAETACDDDVDDNQDGLTDCDDLDCRWTSPCLAYPGGPGAPCWTSDDCDGVGTCWSPAAGFPGGYCYILDCPDNPCPEGNDCFEFTDGVSRCIPTCGADSECRVSEGYECDSYDTCWWAAGAVPPGGSCGASEQCAGGDGAYCIEQLGFIGGYCIVIDCTFDGQCPAGGTCRQVMQSGAKACVPSCGEDADCREGYRCRQEPGSQWDGVCYPGCDSDDECPGPHGCREEVCVDLRTWCGPENLFGRCQADHYCRQGACVPFACGPENPAGDCEAGQVCDAGTCVDFVCLDTQLEPNDAQGEAAALPEENTAGFQICAQDDDWYVFVPDKADALYHLGIDYAYGSGDLEITQNDADGAVLSMGTFRPEDYHDENPLGPVNLEIHGVLGAAGSDPVWLHVYGPGDAINNYGMVYREFGWKDGRDCEALFGRDDCLALTGGRHDPSKLMNFPRGNPADPYVGAGFFFEHAYQNVPFTTTASLYAKRELIMIMRWALHEVQTAFPGTGPLGIGDISMPDGSTPWGHTYGTHYYGSNVDVAYFIKPEFDNGFGNLAYRQICCSHAVPWDWSCLNAYDTAGPDYGMCLSGSEETHIVDVERTAMLIAKIAGTGRLRVVGVEAEIEADLDAALDALLEGGLITQDEYSAAHWNMSTANDHISWAWHFHHMHFSFLVDPDAKGSARGDFQGPFLEGTPDEQAERIEDFHRNMFVR